MGSTAKCQADSQSSNIYIYVHIHIYIYIYIHVSIYYTQVCAYLCVYFTRACAHTHTHIFASWCVCAYGGSRLETHLVAMQCMSPGTSCYSICAKWSLSAHVPSLAIAHRTVSKSASVVVRPPFEGPEKVLRSVRVCNIQGHFRLFCLLLAPSILLSGLRQYCRMTVACARSLPSSGNIHTRGKVTTQIQQGQNKTT